MQAVISASQAIFTGESDAKQVYIPTPETHVVVSKKFEQLQKRPFSLPHSHIRFSSTVEECIGVAYTMDEEDAEWLQSFNAKSKKDHCSELAFETIMDHFEGICNERQPFLSTDLSSILTWQEMEPTFAKTPAAAYKLYAKQIYAHWRERRVANVGLPIMPSLRTEEPDKDDNDPYICFRRREVRQVRKTRRTDAQSSDRLRRLKTELEQARNILEMVSRREKLRKDNLLMEQLIFDHRCTYKKVKRKLGLPDDPEDEQLLISHKRKRVSDQQGTRLPKLPLKPPEQAIFTLDTWEKERDKENEKILQERLEKIREDALEWEDTTLDPFMPELTPTDWVVYPPSPPPSSPKHYNNVQYDTLKNSQICVRYRTGRGGRVLVDRRRLPTPPPEIDQFDGALFRATLNVHT